MKNQTDIVNPQPSTPERVAARPVVSPRVDIYENAEELLLVAELPGVIADNVAVHVDDGELTVSGIRSDTVEGTAQIQSYQPFDYERRFRLPQTVDPNNIRAVHRDGVLSLHIGKRTEVKPRRIQVTSS